MRKLLLINNRPNTSGIGRYTYELISSLIRCDNKIIAVEYLNWDSKLYDALFRYALEINNKVMLYAEETLRIISQLFFALRIPKNLDLYHLTSPSLGFSLLFLKPSVVTIHDLVPFIEPRSATDLFIQKSLYFVGRADRIICISENTKKDLFQFINVNPKKIRVIYHGIDHELFKPRDKVEVRRRLELPLNKPIVLNVGSEEPRKNVSILLKAFSKLQKDITNAILVRIGEKTSKVQSLINLLGLNDKVFYFKPYEVAYFYNAADLLCFPSYYEGFGLPPLEAMSSGCPVIAGNRTSIPEIVGDAGILLNPFDVDGFAYWMREVLMDDDLRKKVSKKGLKRSMMFSWEKCAKETLEVYKEVLVEG